MKVFKPLATAAVASVIWIADGALKSRLHAQSSESRAGVAQQGRPSCEQIRLGMTYQYEFRFSPGAQPGTGTTDYPKLGTVCPGSPAARAGLAVGDVVLELNGGDFRDRKVRETLRSPPGTDLVFRIRRGGSEREVTVRVPPLPQAPPSQR